MQLNLDKKKAKGLAKHVCGNDVSLNGGSFPYILLLLGRRISFVVPRTSLYGRSLYRGSTGCPSLE